MFVSWPSFWNRFGMITIDPLCDSQIDLDDLGGSPSWSNGVW